GGVAGPAACDDAAVEPHVPGEPPERPPEAGRTGRRPARSGATGARAPEGWVLTCDPGVDDAVALAVAAGRADCPVRAVVAGAGNVDAATAWRNAAGLARLLGLDVPVAMGSDTTVDGRPIRRGPSAHGADGLAGLARRLPAAAHGPAPAATSGPGARPQAGTGSAAGPAPAATSGPGARPQAGTGSAAARPGGASAAGDAPIPAGPGGRGLVAGDVIATGPLTEVALALARPHALGRVVWMGGSFAPAAGDAAPAGREFNARADPVAVDAVLRAALDLAVVPVEVTRRVSLDADDLVRWWSGPPAARLCADLAARRRHHGRGPVVLHDPVAVVAALEPGLFSWQRRPVR